MVELSAERKINCQKLTGMMEKVEFWYIISSCSVNNFSFHPKIIIILQQVIGKDGRTW